MNKIKKFLLSSGVLVAFATATQAAIITQTVNQSSASATGWNASIWGSPTAAATSSNDYVTPSGFVVRTPEAGTSTFVGASLTIQGGTLALKSGNNASRTNTVNNLKLEGGTIANFTSGNGTTQTLAGSIQIVGTTTSVSKAGGTNETRNNFYTATVGGAADTTFQMESVTSTSVNQFSNSANTFSGLWDLNSGILRFTNSGSVGNGDIRVDGGTLEIQHNWLGSASSSLTTTAGTIALSTYAWTLGTLTVGSTSFTPGTYNISSLNGLGGGTFTGTGSITVIPEPSAALLGALGVLGLLRRRR